MAFCWLMIFIVLLLLELCTVNLVSIWFAVGAMGAFITAMITDNILIQLGVFIIVSTIMLLLTKPIVKRLKFNKVATNLDRVLGMYAIVTEEIDKFKIGEVKVDGKKWSAVADSKIEEGEEVVIEKIEGAKLIVKRKDDK